jgi:DNA polymerase IV
VPAGKEAAFLAPLPISRLWGAGERTVAVLGEYGVATIGDLAALPADLLARRFGTQGPVLAERARGVDPSPVGGGDPAKSVSHEHTFDADTNDWEVIERTLLGLSEGVARRLRKGGVKAGTIAVKVRDSSFATVTRQRTLPQPTDQTDTIWRTALALARPEVKAIRVRLLGVAASHLSEREQLALFPVEGDRRRKATAAMDQIRDRYGSRAITRARLLEAPVAEPFERDPMTAPEANRIGRPDSNSEKDAKRAGRDT